MRMLALALLLSPAAAVAADAPYSFTYTYPAQASAVPRLKAWLDAESARQKAALVRDVRAAQAEARKDGFPFRPYDLSREWFVVADTPRFLSLSMTAYDYTGGAHGNTSTRSLVFDRTTGTRRAVASFFASVPALQKALEPALCRAVNAERKARGVEQPSDLWDRCPKLTDATLLLGSASRRRFDRIGVQFDPYAIGSYAEGGYEVTLPVTPAVLAVVKPVDRPAFELGR